MKKLVLFLCFGFAVLSVKAQQLPYITQYYLSPYLINPSYAGFSGETTMSMLYRKQWSNIPGAPLYFAFSADGYLPNSKIGLGVKFSNEIDNFLGKTSGSGAISYNLTLGEEQFLRFGLSANATYYRIYFDRLRAADPFENAILERAESSTVFDADFGINYTYKNLNIGLAAQQLIQSHLIFKTENSDQALSLKQIRHYNLWAGYALTSLMPNWKFVPGVSLASAQGSKSLIEINTRAIYKDFMWGTINYRHNVSVGFALGIDIDQSLSFGYAFDLPINKISEVSNDTHELILRYRFANKKIKKLESEVDKLKEELVEQNELVEQYAIQSSEETTLKFNEAMSAVDSLPSAEEYRNSIEILEQQNEEQKAIIDGLYYVNKDINWELFKQEQDIKHLENYLNLLRLYSNSNMPDYKPLKTLNQRRALSVDSLIIDSKSSAEIKKLELENYKQNEKINQLIEESEKTKKDIELYNKAVVDLQSIVDTVTASQEESKVIVALYTFKYAKAFQKELKRKYKIESEVSSIIIEGVEYFTLANSNAIEVQNSEIKSLWEMMVFLETRDFEKK